jgi:hypothetical protein
MRKIVFIAIPLLLFSVAVYFFMDYTYEPFNKIPENKKIWLSIHAYQVRKEILEKTPIGGSASSHKEIMEANKFICKIEIYNRFRVENQQGKKYLNCLKVKQWSLLGYPLAALGCEASYFFEGDRVVDTEIRPFGYHQGYLEPIMNSLKI